MIITCGVVGGAMAVVYTIFTKRLNKIEEERWGKKKDVEPAKMPETPKAQEKAKKA